MCLLLQLPLLSAFEDAADNAAVQEVPEAEQTDRVLPAVQTFDVALPAVAESQPASDAGGSESLADSKKAQLPPGVSSNWFAAAQENIKQSEY